MPYTEEEIALLKQNRKDIKEIAKEVQDSPHFDEDAIKDALNEILSVLEADGSLLLFEKSRDARACKDLLEYCGGLSEKQIRERTKKFAEALRLKVSGSADRDAKAPAATQKPPSSFVKRALGAAGSALYTGTKYVAKAGVSLARGAGHVASAGRAAIEEAVGERLVEYVRANYRDEDGRVKRSAYPTPNTEAERKADMDLKLAGIALIDSCGSLTQMGAIATGLSAITNLVSASGAAKFLGGATAGLAGTAFRDMATAMRKIHESGSPDDKEVFFNSEFGDKLRMLGLISSAMPGRIDLAGAALVCYSDSMTTSLAASGGIYASILGYDIMRLIRKTKEEGEKPEEKRYRPGTDEFGFVPTVPKLKVSLMLGFGIVAIGLICVPPLGVAFGFAGAATTIAAMGIPEFIAAGALLSGLIFAGKSYLPKTISRAAIGIKRAFTTLKNKFSRKPVAPELNARGSGLQEATIPPATEQPSQAGKNWETKVGHKKTREELIRDRPLHKR